MVGHYLLSLSNAAENRVLTTAMKPGDYVAVNLLNGPCLVGTAVGATHKNTWRLPANVAWGSTAVEVRYDDLCARFGAARVNAAIRLRILQNRARRVLQYDTAKSNGEVAMLSS